jgi:hypothetical protein
MTRLEKELNRLEVSGIEVMFHTPGGTPDSKLIGSTIYFRAR